MFWSRRLRNIEVEIRLAREERADTHQFMREMVLRMDQITERHERAMSAVVKELRDLGAESRAQRRALLQVIDRMDRLDPGGAAA